MGKVSGDTNFCLGLQDDQIKGPNKDKLMPWEIKKFDDCSVKSMAAGNKSSYIFTDLTKEVREMTTHKLDDG